MGSSEFPFQTACAVALERRHRPAGEASLRPCGTRLERTLYAHHRGSGETIQFRNATRRETCWSMAILRQSGAVQTQVLRTVGAVAFNCSAMLCATSTADPKEHTKAVRGTLPDDPGPVNPLPALHSGVECISCLIGDHARAALLIRIASEG